MDAMTIYKALSQPPKDALKQIEAGKLKGKTDINPQWRYRAMTEQFGLAGIGWKYEIEKLWTETGAGGEVLAFARVAVFIKDGEAWSYPIYGVGGSKLVQIEKGNPVSNDEGYKMAVTDAFSAALKMIGVAADIYAGAWDGSKYRPLYDEKKSAHENTQQGQPQTPPAFTPKGGASTPEETQTIQTLLKSTYPNGQRIFTNMEVGVYSALRKEKTAQEVIAEIQETLSARLRQQNAASA